jgi:hypothetical protein
VGLKCLHELRHGRRCRLRFFSRSSPELLLEVVDEDGRQLVRGVGGETAKMDWWRVGQKLAGEKNKGGGTVELESRRDLAMATLRKG